MCGLAGFIEFGNGRSEDELRTIAGRMAAAVHHRGPDGLGLWVDAKAGVALGHTRLAIIDLSSSGAQPMVSADGRFVIVYNGEIYNHIELRKELVASGCRFRGHSDTEVILEGCVAWGLIRTLERLIGMFAFALWNRRTRTLQLARDRIGIKPLYWAHLGEAFAFGSELKALRAYPGWTPSIDQCSLVDYLRYGYVPAPRSIYQSVSKLLPGTIATIRENGPPHIERYWDICTVAADGLGRQFAGDDATAVNQFEALLSDAVRRQMIADVPLGAFLSGGIDSSTVVALMQAQSSRPVKTYSIGFAENEFNETQHAKAVADHLGTDHTELYVEPSHGLEVVQQLPEWFDEPIADASQIPTYLVSALSRRDVKVTLSGDGGDELFFGYDRYLRVLMLAHWLGMMPRRVRSTGALLLNPLRRLPPGFVDNVFRAAPPGLRPRRPGHKLHRLLDLLAFDGTDGLNRQMRSLWPEPEQLVLGMTAPTEHGMASILPAEIVHPMDRMQLLDMLSYLPDDILTKVDRASMAVSLEVRVPLLDHRVVEFSWQLPRRMKLRERQQKWLLRQVLFKFVPKIFVERPKMGFEVPLAAWLRGPLRDWVESMIDERRLRTDGLLDPQAIRQRWDEHLKGRRNWHASLWAILMFQSWKARWLDM
ncbi:MAG: asparagine synthase (glutamine-hydrolyzing) [Aestuariivirga sp.]